MTQGEIGPLVAKFGGTSMARPDLVMNQLEYPDNRADVVVVSAPGTDSIYADKTTDMLIGLQDGVYIPDDIQTRFEHMLERTGGGSDEKSREVVAQIPQDLSEWESRGDPIEALGEYWSAKLFAIRAGREFVDPRGLIFFDNDGSFDDTRSGEAIRGVLGGAGPSVVPGFFGMRQDGQVGVFPRGGSDITGAEISKALGARQYHNWSDVPGFMTADPRVVEDARLLPQITYREARELGNGGSELLHREVIKTLGNTGIDTVMKQTAGPIGDRGTIITDERAWQWQQIIGVTGRDDLQALTLHEFGLNEGVGTTVDVYKELEAAQVPYEYTATGTDDVAIYVSSKYDAELDQIVTDLRSAGRTIELRKRAGLVHVVGEGLAQSGTTRLKALGTVASALAAKNISGQGATDVGGSATLTLFIPLVYIKPAIRTAHEALGLRKPE